MRRYNHVQKRYTDPETAGAGAYLLRKPCVFRLPQRWLRRMKLWNVAAEFSGPWASRATRTPRSQGGR